jgi:hypothetical protein
VLLRELLFQNDGIRINNTGYVACRLVVTVRTHRRLDTGGLRELGTFQS